ncbi:MAG: stage III sporulation protein AF [Clostridia bacterium]|nr:stage III sporulation protein AF [Clostridia bacterium]
MIEILSSWAKGLGITIVIVSIFEMLLPNNRTKKYIRMVLGVYVIFNIVSPLIKNKDVFNFNNIDLEEYTSVETSSVNQTSMNERIKKLYSEELEKDITKKIKEKGYEVKKCKVSVQIADDEEETKINKIKLIVSKTQEEVKNDIENSAENKIVTEIQKIRKIDTGVEIKKQEKEKNEVSDKVNKTEIQNIKKFLIEEYGVNEKCLEIN